MLQFEELNLSKLHSATQKWLLWFNRFLSLLFCLFPLKIPLTPCVLSRLHFSSSYLFFPSFDFLPACPKIMLPPHITIESRMASIGSLVNMLTHKPLMVKPEVCGGGVRWGRIWWEAPEQWVHLRDGDGFAARAVGAKPQVFYGQQYIHPSTEGFKPKLKADELASKLTRGNSMYE